MLNHELKNLMISFKLNPDKSVHSLVNLAHLPSEEVFEVGLAKMTQKSEHRKAGVYSYKRENIKFPDNMFRGREAEAIVQYYHGEASAAFVPWFSTLEQI